MKISFRSEEKRMGFGIFLPIGFFILSSFLFAGQVFANSLSGVSMCSSADTIVRGQGVSLSTSDYGASCSGYGSGTYYPENTTTFRRSCTRGDGIGGTYYTEACVTVTVQVPGICGPADGTSTYYAPTSGLCSQGSASAVYGSGPWYWTCYGSSGGTNASCSALKKVDGGWSAWSPCTQSCGYDGTQYRTCTDPTPQNGGSYCSGISSQSCNVRDCLTVCESTPSGWFLRHNGSSLTTIAQGGTTLLKAFYDMYPDCSGTEVTISGTDWAEISDPNGAFAVSAGRVDVSQSVTGNIASGSMRVWRNDGYSSVDLLISGYCGWAVTCANTSDRHCIDEQYRITDPVCGSKTCTAGGTRECEFNWTEVTPSL